MTGSELPTLPTRPRAALLTGVATAAVLLLSACTSSSGGGEQNSPGPGTSPHPSSSEYKAPSPKPLTGKQLTVTFKKVSKEKDAHLEGPVDLVRHQGVQQVSYSHATKTLTVTMSKGATAADRQIVENLVRADRTGEKSGRKKPHK